MGGGGGGETPPIYMDRGGEIGAWQCAWGALGAWRGGGVMKCAQAKCAQRNVLEQYKNRVQRNFLSFNVSVYCQKGGQKGGQN